MRNAERTMKIELSYGRGTLPVELPDGLEVTVIRKPER
jgi:hypothetical protein